MTGVMASARDHVTVYPDSNWTRPWPTARLDGVKVGRSVAISSGAGGSAAFSAAAPLALLLSLLFGLSLALVHRSSVFGRAESQVCPARSLFCRATFTQPAVSHTTA